MNLHFLSAGAPDQVSGGYLYNKYLMRHLHEAGIAVEYHADTASIERFGENDTVIVDSLVISAALERLLTTRASLILLLHIVPNAHGGCAGSASLQALYRRSRIVATGDATLTYLRERLDGARVDAVKIEPGVPAHWRRKKRYAGTARHLLTVANYLDGKGISQALEALACIKELPWSWSVFGNDSLDPAYFRTVARKAAAYRLLDRIELKGPIPHEAVNEHMLQSDLLVHFSSCESYSMVTAEAIAAGLPVLSYRTGNHAAFARSGLVRYLDSDVLAADALGSLIRDECAYSTLRGTERGEQRTWKNVGNEFLTWLGSAR